MSIPTVGILDSNGIIGLAKADCFPMLLMRLISFSFLPGPD